jgi:sterol desaturase/sphingolipid hydroxylase (fatty acid hydroxylase superfamily)
MEKIEKEKFSIYKLIEDAIINPFETFEKIISFLKEKGYFNLHDFYLQFVDSSIAGGLFYYKNILLYASLFVFFIIIYGHKKRQELLYHINPLNFIKYQSFKIDLSFLILHILKINSLIINIIISIFLLRKFTEILNELNFYKNPISQAISSYFNTLNSASENILLFILAYLVYDFGRFYAHYLLHRYDFLWVFHRVHHYPEQLTWISTIRAHPIDGIFMWFFPSLLMGLFISMVNGQPTLLNEPGELISNNGLIYLIIVYIPGVLNFLSHSKLPIYYGKYLGSIFISPVDHMIHHSKDISGKNFGGTFSIWDALFKTKYSINSYSEYVKFASKLGVDDADDFLYKNIFQAFISPFKESMVILKDKVKRIGAW